MANDMVSKMACLPVMKKPVICLPQSCLCPSGSQTKQDVQRVVTDAISAGPPEPGPLHVASLLQKLPVKTPTHLAQLQQPWSRLSSTPTATSLRQDAYFFDPKIPKDDLDFRLATLYDHHTGAFKSKSEVLLHQETAQNAPRITRIQLPEEPSAPSLPPSISGANIIQWINPKKESVHSTQGSIVSPHTAATNRGYSRKNDGGFFST
ncbi:uncharacterized protein C1orf194 homolog [Carlito syrichta]|uniref:Uncharacterized protein C1orf194 homolog n=1 Tax=Carlito syrichta TaxID=1868482 RepID=A0A3Q0E0K1_CARSF|nr:uncharacterized protein C1orf194 homolog [Carlito syrichta]